MSDAYDNEFGYLESACAAGARYEDAPCDYVGVIEAEPADDSRHGELLTGHGFECTTTMVDAFTIAADIDAFDVWTWLVDDEAVLVEADYRPWNELRYFMMGLITWFRREHHGHRRTRRSHLLQLPRRRRSSEGARGDRPVRLGKR